MDSRQLQKLISEPEGLKLDFKSKMYQLSSDSQETRKRQSDEMIKDLLALTNGNVTVAREPGYLVIGADDKLKLDKSRDLYDVGHINITSQSILERVNSACNPPIPEIKVDTIVINKVRLFIFIIPPDPYLHETTRRLETSKASYSEGIVFIRRAEGIHPALSMERDAIKEAKRIAFQDILSEPKKDEDQYNIEKQRFFDRLDHLRGIKKAKALFGRSELLMHRIKNSENKGEETSYINQLFIDTKSYLEMIIKTRKLGSEYKSRSYFMLAKIYDEFEHDPFTSYDYCTDSINKREDYSEAYRLRIKLGEALLLGDDNSYREKAEKNLPLDRDKLEMLINKKETSF